MRRQGEIAGYQAGCHEAKRGFHCAITPRATVVVAKGLHPYILVIAAMGSGNFANTKARCSSLRAAFKSC